MYGCISCVTSLPAVFVLLKLTRLMSPAVFIYPIVQLILAINANKCYVGGSTSWTSSVEVNGTAGHVSDLPEISPTTLIRLSCANSVPAMGCSDEDRCKEPLDPGPCHYYQVKWYWDGTDELCKEFHYGGCLGSRNRFDNKQQCMKQCVYKMHNPSAIPELCLLDADPGHCNDDRKGHWWYYFNAEDGDCQKFFYYGCGGNDNRFYSLYQCRKVCGERLAPNIACDRCDIRTSVCAAHSKYNYTCECREGYSKNVYGDCVDIDECRAGDAVCDRNAWCANTMGSYACKCMAGYSGDGKKCTYVGIGRATTDCTKCSPHATCLQGVCTCKVGFKGDGFNCTDVNECFLRPSVCHPYAKCRNVKGSYICQCRPGYAGNGYNCTSSPLACMDSFDRQYNEQCGMENWREHYYFDHDSNRCTLFWYDGCPGTSMNIFSNLETCEVQCEMTDVLSRAEICWDLFDAGYRNQCRNGNWEQRFYFDQASLQCRMFWYDGCTSRSRNIFDDLRTCQWMCEQQLIYRSGACLEPFDEHYRDQCDGGRWKQYFFFDRIKHKCIPFWYDGCRGRSQNLFQDENSCIQMCVRPATSDPHAPWHHRDKHEKLLALQKLREEIEHSREFESMEAETESSEVAESSASSMEPKKQQSSTETTTKSRNGSNSDNVTDENICVRANPCQHNGSCHYDKKKKTYYCKCVDGYTNTNCTEKIEFDPCSTNPCKNGATCSVKAGKQKTTYECFCARGYGGIHCDSRPCDDNPCLNNGTCRTTSSYSTFFCDCPPKFGGKLCDIAIGETKPPKYGKNVQLISSGKVEWIEQLKKAKAKELELKKMKNKNMNDKNQAMNDEPAKESDERINEEKGKKKELRESGKEEDVKNTDEELIDYNTVSNETRSMNETDAQSMASMLLNDTVGSIAGGSSRSSYALVICLIWLSCFFHRTR